ncbi:DUF445 domain-containing protein [Sphingomonas lycopersici]|uniref:DUF445 domain-containing protein n=1 Tax=Sphingomonas lycopersici TaxID=2951807 RepID=A0AA42CRQ3_9SPHN|nr:DUF445 domain-containing protein [Sphingomonas lycopersici]MCW6532798.1 DUF445 domain-containing protein [Sphingomonas lycopersici]MCW6536524.1 DUF445 domain-containing protein [Sphingomonas lycopersici]
MIPIVRRRPPHERIPAGLVRMRVVATAMLVVMAATFLVARAVEPLHPGWGFVRAFAEAAMVGGLADWFAVTALFRHPLGLPIPHTAIIPRNKDRIGDQLALFLRDNFLIPHVVARRMRRIDLASAAGRWLSNPTAGGSRLSRGLSRLAVEVLQALDQERLGGMVRGAMVQQVRVLDLSPILGRALAAAISKDRHLPVLDGIVRWAGRVLQANEPIVRAMVHDRAGSILRWTGLDETLANKIIDGLDKMLADMAEDRNHPLRGKAEEGLIKLADDLQHDAAMIARVEQLKLELLENPAMQDWINGLWEQARAAMLRAARDPEALVAGKLREALDQLGQTLQSDVRLQRTLNRYVRRAAVGTAADYGDSIVRLVSETVRGWDAQTITRRLENAVGKDLQFIRINGTLVGGLVGLAIHAVDVAL